MPRGMRHLIGLCLLCVGVAACATEDLAPRTPPVAAAPSWTVDHLDAQGALSSVWGSGPRDVWAAGGRQGHGLVLHNDGNGWYPVQTGANVFLWWIYGLGAQDVYAVGEQGTVLHYDGATWQTVPTGTKRTLYGLWGATPDDVWVVGGDPHGGAGDAIVLRGNAQGFHEVQLPAGLLPQALFKVYGSPEGDVVAVGSGGTILRFDGQQDPGGPWHRDESTTTSPLISLWSGGGNRMYAVGGDATGVVLLFDGSRWTQVAGVGAGLGFFGVFQSPGQSAFAVGAGPRILELEPGQAVEQDTPALDTGMVLHSVWGDGQGTVYAVGGTLYGDPDTMRGVVLKRGGVGK